MEWPSKTSEIRIRNRLLLKNSLEPHSVVTRSGAINIGADSQRISRQRSVWGTDLNNRISSTVVKRKKDTDTRKLNACIRLLISALMLVR